MNYVQVLASIAVVSSFILSAAISQPAFSETQTSSHKYWQDFKQDSNENWKDTKEAFRDGWVESKLETAILMSEYLNPFKIDIDVDNSVAILDGEVDSDVVKEHAELVALSVEGIDKVKNNLIVKKDLKRIEKTGDGDRSFKRAMLDAATTAEIKTELLANSETTGFTINVDTYNRQVTLSGKVSSSAEKALAGYIAKTNSNVEQVDNRLEVGS